MTYRLLAVSPMLSTVWTAGSPPVDYKQGTSERHRHCLSCQGVSTFLLTQFWCVSLVRFSLWHSYSRSVLRHVPAYRSLWCSLSTNMFDLSPRKGEVRTINDRNICERRSCMKNNGKSTAFKFVSGEERRPAEVQLVSRGWRLPGATHSSADPTWIRKWLEIQAPELLTC